MYDTRFFEIVRMTSTNPARVLGEETRIGSLKKGMDADAPILEIKSGLWELEDAENNP